jgi:hypothetical protein
MKEELEEINEIIKRFNKEHALINVQFEKIRQEYNFYNILEEKCREIATDPKNYFENLYFYIQEVKDTLTT